MKNRCQRFRLNLYQADAVRVRRVPITKMSGHFCSLLFLIRYQDVVRRRLASISFFIGAKFGEGKKITCYLIETWAKRSLKQYLTEHHVSERHKSPFSPDRMLLSQELELRNLEECNAITRIDAKGGRKLDRISSFSRINISQNEHGLRFSFNNVYLAFR